MFYLVKYLKGTFRKEEVDGPKYGIFNFCILANYDV
jgi:hypothetical protein